METLFDHEKLDVYGVELQFIALLADFFDDVSQSSVQHRCELLEQLDRASLSALLNTAEGLGRVVAMLTRLVDRFDAKELRVRQDVPAS